MPMKRSTRRRLSRAVLYAVLLGLLVLVVLAADWPTIRANFFAPAGHDPSIEYAWGRQNWVPWSAAEQVACREAVAVFDQSSFSKYVVHGRDAEAALQWICSNDVAVELDRTVYTALLNERGGYESDLTVTRVADDEFFLVASSATTERDQDWLRRHVPDGLDARVAGL